MMHFWLQSSKLQPISKGLWSCLLLHTCTILYTFEMICFVGQQLWSLYLSLSRCLKCRMKAVFSSVWLTTHGSNFLHQNWQGWLRFIGYTSPLKLALPSHFVRSLRSNRRLGNNRSLFILIRTLLGGRHASILMALHSRSGTWNMKTILLRIFCPMSLKLLMINDMAKDERPGTL